MDTLLYLGIIFILGALTEWFSTRFRFSKIVGYMVVGLLIAPGSLGLIPREFVEAAHVIIDFSLAMIAVLIGASLKWSHLKGMTSQIAVVTFFQAFFAFAVVTAGFYFASGVLFPSLESPLVIALLLGGIASATAPAATLAVIQEVRSEGRFTTILLSVVAFDDAMALVLFAFAVTIGGILLGNGHDVSGLTDVIVVILGSIGIGVMAAFFMTALERLFARHKGMQTIATLGMVFLTYNISLKYGFEPLLATLVMGALLINLSPDFTLVEEEIDNHIVEIVYMLFFMISAMHLNPSTLLMLPAVVAAYMVLRFVGKVGGTYVGAKISGAGKDVERYLGLALIPQAGVAIGLALSIQDHAGFEAFSPILLNVIIATTIVHELLGPFMTRYALRKSGECPL